MASFFFVNLDPKVITLALLCNLDKLVDRSLQHTAALTPFDLLADIAIPVPEPQTNMPTSLFFVLTLTATFLAKSG